MTTGYSLPAGLISSVVRPPFRVQIAYDGNWMNAWRLDPDALPSPDAAEKAIAGRTTDVAVEFCFELAGGGNYFFGQRRVGQRNDRNALEFVNGALACSRGRDWTDFPDFLSRLSGALPNRGPTGRNFLCRDLDNVEIGITDWWRRGDVVEVWSTDSPAIPERDQLAKELAPYPSLQKNNINFTCLEFNFRSPLHHWFGIEISDYEGGFHILNISKAHSWLLKCLSTK
jgi:hypothetical protein